LKGVPRNVRPELNVFFDRLSNSSPAVRRFSEGRISHPPGRSSTGEDMPQYLVSIQLPDNYDPSREDEAVIRDVHALNEEMDAVGIRLFAGGLEPASKAKTLRKQANGDVIITDGPYVEAKEHIGGFSIVEAADMDEALAWARKAALACRVPVEVRGIFFRPRPNSQA
jgi:hypothetical protein